MKPWIVVLEDSAADAELAVGMLREGGLDFDASVATAGPGYEQLLQAAVPDLILADFDVPAYSGQRSFELARKLAPASPFILLCGAASGQTAVEMMKAGVTDVLFKDRLGALGSSVKRALDESRRLGAARLAAEREAVMLGALPILFFRFTPSADVIHIGGHVLGLTGFAPERFLQNARFWIERIHADDRDRVVREFAGKADAARTEFRWQVADGRFRWFVAHGVRVSGLGGGEREVVGVWIENDERKREQEALRASEERFALTVRGSSVGIWDWDFTAGRIYLSPRWKSLLGCADEDIGSDPNEWLSRVHPDDQAGLKSAIDVHRTGSTPTLENEHRLRHDDGRWISVLCRGVAVRDPSGRATRMAGSITDISDLKRAQEQILRNVFVDSLTGLANRQRFIDRVAHSLSLLKRRIEFPFAVLVLDLDRFGQINESLGLSTGDRFLEIVARKLTLTVHDADTVARLGEDEFALLIADVRSSADAVRVAETAQRALAMPTKIGGREIVSSASIGIITEAAAYDRAEDLLRDADAAMFRAKSLGGARWQIFDRSMHEASTVRFALQGELRQALDRQELMLYYQPIVSLETGRIVGAEGLARWKHPARGMISPAEFIPVAEETGLIVPIGEWCLREACTRLVDWAAAGLPPITIAVNLSAKQFRQKDLVAVVSKSISDAGAPASRLKLEVTESAVMEDAELARAVLLKLKALGLSLSLDDFGTGYSSLAYLKKFPFSILKIDRTFVKELPGNGDDAAIASAIVLLARTLKLGVVAEGVETVEQREFLKGLGCDEFQGFLFSKPLPPDDFVALLKKEPRDSGEPR